MNADMNFILAAFSAWHIIVLLAVILLIFGGKKIPELARGLAKGMRIFRDEMRGIQTDIESSDSPSETASKTSETDKASKP